MDPSIWLIVVGVPTFLSLQFIAAPYGKFAPKQSVSSWGPRINAKVAWALQETPSLLLSLTTFINQSDPKHYHASGNRLLLALFLFHYLFRAWILPLTVRASTPMPAFLCAISFVFCVCNGWLQGWSLGHSVGPFEINEMSFLRWFGVIMFFVGWASNQYSDYILRSLRKSGDHSYHIPHGGLFKYVTSANYFSEFVEWSGFALASQSMAGVAFALYTAANLFPRAKSTHDWYHNKFPNYPKDRKIVIPFIW